MLSSDLYFSFILFYPPFQKTAILQPLQKVTSWHSCGGQRATFRSMFSPYLMQVLYTVLKAWQAFPLSYLPGPLPSLFLPPLKIVSCRSGKMAQRLRELTALPENPNAISSIHMAAQSNL